jgi:xanthine dehydrogenase accessory factor
MPGPRPLILVRGGGDLASGVILRLYRAGLQVVVSELAEPLAVRRTVSFAEAVYDGQQTVEGVTARLVERGLLTAALDANEVPVLVDPEAEILQFDLAFLVVVDARLTKHTPAPLSRAVPLHIGLGPGFHAGENCQAVVETRRSHTLGRVYWQGAAQPDSGQPEGDSRRVLRAVSDGRFVARKKIGEHCEPGDLIGEIYHPNEDRASEIRAPLAGILRGIIRDGVHVTRGLKIGDVDPRDDPSACFLVSDKALAIGGGVLEAILSRVDIRSALWSPLKSHLSKS